MNIAEQLGSRVRDLRRGKLITQKEMSEVCGIERSYLSRIERGQFKPQLDTIVLLAQGVRVTLSELFEGIEIEDMWEKRRKK
jgi:transcriptional regulator with XRE-family HTH domain